MPDFPSRSQDRVLAYCGTRGMELDRYLGFGKDGTVWATLDNTAVKAHERRHTYERELEVYGRLAAQHCTIVAGHAVPLLLDTDDQLGIIEMAIVRPPFVLDFASAQLDQPFEFPPDILEEWYNAKSRDFGVNWGRAVAVLRELERMGIYMVDVHPGNIGFPQSSGGGTIPGASSSDS